MSSDLPDKLRAWLAHEGYPFELRVGRVLNQAGWDVFHAHHYVDPDSGKLREVDVHAAFGPYVGGPKGPGMVSIHLVCECKVSQAKPWIVFTSRHGDDDLRLAPHLTTGEPSCQALADGVFTNRGKLSTFVTGPRIGHGVTKAFADSRSGDPVGPFAAILGAMSAAIALSEQHYSSISRGDGNTSWLSIYMPVVIVLGQLFEYYLDDTGDEVLAECSRAHILAYPTGPEPIPVVVQIVTADALAEFAASAFADARFLAAAIRPKAHEIWRSYWQRSHGTEG